MGTATDDEALKAFARAASAGDEDSAGRMLAASPPLAGVRLAAGATRQSSAEAGIFLTEIRHYLYAGDTALHAAAAAHRPGLAGSLIGLGADLEAANRRGARPLHYAADGIPGWSAWRAEDQALTVRRLLEAGAQANAGDIGGVTPLHRAVRNRCSAVVAALLEHGADPAQRTRKGSTALDLTRWTTGRGGAGSAEATAELERIRRLLGA